MWFFLIVAAIGYSAAGVRPLAWCFACRAFAGDGYPHRCAARTPKEPK